jgi:hypothetical protein
VHRGDAEVEQDPRDASVAAGVEDRTEVVEPAADERDLDRRVGREGREALVGERQRRRVAVESDEQARP